MCEERRGEARGETQRKGGGRGDATGCDRREVIGERQVKAQVGGGGSRDVEQERF